MNPPRPRGDDPLPRCPIPLDRDAPAPCRRDLAPGGHTCSDHAAQPDLPGPFLGAISYRQVDYWTRVGYLRPAEPTPGSGIARDWPGREVVVATLMRRLLDAGVELRVAARVAREQVEDGLPGTARLRGGIVIDLAS